MTSVDVMMVIHFHLQRSNGIFYRMDDGMKEFQQMLIEVETEAEHLLLARHQMVENDRIRNANREAMTGLRRKAKTTKSSVPTPFESIMKEVEGSESKTLMKEICKTCGNHDAEEHTWMMFPGSDFFARVPFHAAHAILDKEFPDEVETPLDVPSRKCFAKYRGLKSFRTSSWDPKESLPFDYARTFGFDNFSRTQKHVLAKVLEVDKGIEHECAAAGSYVRLHIKKVPLDVASKLCGASRNLPVVVCGLLQHESRIYVLHFSIKKHDSYETPIKSKEALSGLMIM
ncbi:hypothetical protein H6P81_015795 [Aristolochia fimbriata]|uniref:Ribosome biogenesis protein BMS1/TSR1 C-terminal domain-containing protein n=1 Tax=Aristolochia fimbriata TaxID=158543 RepID=A0AAV7E6H9_ARIFI|nr:hypothetical protein H6P81_015795 [Aristolochia fimbriata]